ncbi:MAG TPA: ferritin-like domain-containing protein [Lacipirellulaceae bacterium]|nr:ferritin-like domain-containing protein [Lacipirellulaceae bacterium]
MKLDSFDALFLHELQDLYSAEKQLIAALPKMAKKASSEELKGAFEKHLEQTKGQQERLETIFKDLELSTGRHKCKAMEGLIEEASELMKEDAEPGVLDAALIGAAQRVEHYEIAGYGTARTFAEMLGHTDAAQLLQETLDEEKDTDVLLTELALTTINVEAQNESER